MYKKSYMTKLFFSLCFFLSIPLSTTAQNEDSVKLQKKYKAYYEKGMEYSNSGNFDEAINCFEKALSFKPDDPDATKMLELNRKRKSEHVNELESQVKKILEYADRQYKDANYEKALLYYERYKKLSGATDRDEQIKVCKEVKGKK
jgi:tetratricopeptide (TPR) repeat protein